MFTHVGQYEHWFTQTEQFLTWVQCGHAPSVHICGGQETRYRHFNHLLILKGLMDMHLQMNKITSSQGVVPWLRRLFCVFFCWQIPHSTFSPCLSFNWCIKVHRYAGSDTSNPHTPTHSSIFVLPRRGGLWQGVPIFFHTEGSSSPAQHTQWQPGMTQKPNAAFSTFLWFSKSLSFVAWSGWKSTKMAQCPKRSRDAETQGLPS